MKGYILRDKEVEDEAKKARKAKKQGQWIVGRWERQASGRLRRGEGGVGNTISTVAGRLVSGVGQ